MSNYTGNDYALNKNSENIVYRFGDEIKEVTLEDYLKDNPKHTIEDFKEIKALSDEMFYEEDRATSNYRKKKLSIHTMDENKIDKSESILDKLVREEESKEILEATYKLLKSGKLTEIQKRRFILHIFKGQSIRKIAAIDGVEHQSVFDSLVWANKKLKKFI